MASAVAKSRRSLAACRCWSREAGSAAGWPDGGSGRPTGSSPDPFPMRLQLQLGLALAQDLLALLVLGVEADQDPVAVDLGQDRKSTRLHSSHVAISYAVFCL